MATTTTIKHSGDIHHQNTVTLHHLGSLTHMKNEGNLFAYSVSAESSEDLILYTSSQMNGSMDFLLEGEAGGNGSGGSSASTSSHESIANLLDEGLGTSLDGTDDISTSIHSTLGRNDSGVFSGDEATGIQPQPMSQSSASSSNCSSTSTDTTPATPCATTTTASSPAKCPEESSSPGGTSKKNRSKTSSPNRQGPQRCAICGKTFSNASALTKHKLTHSDERKHACSMCGKAFKRQDHLNGHMLTHRNKKPFECTSKGCGKSYCDARSLRRHVESRHGHETLASMTIGLMAHSAEEQAETNNNNVDHPRHTSKTGKKKSSRSASNGSSLGFPGSQIQSIPALSTEETGNEMLSTVSESLLLETDVLGLDSELFPAQDPDFQVEVVEVKMEEGVTEEAENKYVMIKMEDMLVDNVCEEDVLLNNNNILLSPGTMVSLLGDGSGNKSPPAHKFPNGLVKVNKSSMRASQSQLHQLLTQRASANGTSSSNTISPNPSPITTTTTVLSLNPGAVIKEEASLLYGPNWRPNVTKEEMSKCCVVPSRGSALESPVLGPSGGRNKQTSSGSTTGAKSSGHGTSSSPALLKEQLELIHQIIQQAQEESIISNSTPPVGKTAKGKKSKSNSAAAAAAAAALANPSSACFSKLKLESDELSGKSEDKPVECTICCRRFKNTPALNGHMRLHGGYFKGGKDPDGRKKDASSKESANTPLQTASVSIRALIEEKIIQKRNTTTVSTQGSIGIESKSLLVGSVNQVSSSECQSGFVETPRDSVTVLTEDDSFGSPRASTATSSFLQQLNHSTSRSRPFAVVASSALLVAFTPTTFTTAPSAGTPETQLGLTTTLCGEEETEETFQFIYSEDTDNTDYLLMEEEVFNKVSSICPDSFLDGIDESILSAANGAEDLGSEWNWTSGSDSRLNSLFNNTASSDSPPNNFSKLSGGPFTPLPPLDSAVFYSSPTPQSPSIHSQDSPCFMYPTPPASLESHNALQSPLFPFQSATSGSTPLLYPFEPTQPSFTCPPGTNRQPTIINMMEMDGQSPLDPPLFSTVTTTSSNNFSAEPGTPTGIDVNSLLSNRNFNNLGQAEPNDGGGSILTPTTMLVRHFGSVKARSASGGSSSETVNFLTPSCSPSLMGSSSTEDSVQSVKELRVNEVGRMDCSLVDGDVFLNPNSVPSPCIKSPKRKQVRNTFASNLRPQTTPSHPSSATQSAHFTPYPILSPVRSAPGLYWTFSAKLSHVDDTKRERPRINVGSDFQVTQFPVPQGRKRKRGSLDDQETAEENDIGHNEQSFVMREDHLWDPTVLNNCTAEEVDKYLEFACCSAVPGGGRNKEYALHLLSLCGGDINSAILLLMNREPVLPTHLTQYKYPEKEKWSREEILSFQDALLKHGKDFIQVAHEIRTKRSEDCVIFYQLWKKVCSVEYEKIRNVWKKRDATFTLDLLKNVPPPSTCLNPRPHPNITHQLEFTENKIKAPVVKSSDLPSSSSSTSMSDVVSALTLQSHEEFPCKVCGKVFNKVKSRSAHMKSHRPPDPPSEGNTTSPLGKKNTAKFLSKASSNPVMKPRVVALNNNNVTTPNKSLIPALTEAQPKASTTTHVLLDTEVTGRSSTNRDT